jgi:hypothetical protein
LTVHEIFLVRNLTNTPKDVIAFPNYIKRLF